MIFGIIIACISAIPALFFLWLFAMSIIENIKSKKRGEEPVFQSNFIEGTGVMGVALLVFSVAILCNAFSPHTNTNKGQNSAKCMVCEREFQKDSENAKSIRKTNMCTKCYMNYKNASDYLKELPVN